ncbi:peptidoglycan DD-metalloendopeptidase family protein [Curtobacterium sp. MCLR17_007]|uniref:peptidoglycan DD-metalloendopeptidase family protein n=1 Tax=Curtobacterium sp. MCLR17_007 TaxID=2175648 RepID=UPI000DA9DA78|nr:peptidoglycan DD-metalloendopeptidase family protein [Curtobacterium sp. MCLR17_007]WIB60534.1 peptidoglycan DD-metalloendopeptidase family protein [Curtobacterium sp. MCLR17_007]
MRRTHIWTRTVTAVTAVAIALAGALVVAAPAQAATYTALLPAGSKLYPGDSVTSPNGQYRVVMQGDGNLVEYGIGNVVMWASNTANKPGAVAVARKDGYLVLTMNGVIFAKWGPNGYTSKGFSVEADGSMRTTDTAGAVRWQIASFQGRVPAGTVLTAGTTLRTDASTSCVLTMQADGNLVQYTNGRATWSTRTYRNPGAWTAVQADGNLVVYRADRKAIWSTKTYRAGGGQLLLQVDGNVVLYGKAGTRVWSAKPISTMQWPVVSRVISGRYGDDRGAGHVPRYHQGTDAAVPIGTPVYSSGPGTVTKTVANDPSYGNYVVVTYGVTTVLTAHLSKIEVTTGQTVGAEQEIAKSGNTGQSTGPHVHVETRVNGNLVDPLTVLQFR